MEDIPNSRIVPGGRSYDRLPSRIDILMDNTLYLLWKILQV